MVNLIKEYEKKIVAKSSARRVAAVSFTEDAVILQFVKTFRAQRKKKITISQKRTSADTLNPKPQPQRKRKRKDEQEQEQRPDLEPTKPTAESNESDESDESDESEEEADGGLNKQTLGLQQLNIEHDGMSRDYSDNIEEIDSKTCPDEFKDNFANATKLVKGWLESAEHESNSKPPSQYGTSAEAGKVFADESAQTEMTAVVRLTNRMKSHTGPAGTAMPGQKLTHVVDFACVYGAAVATLVDKIGMTSAHFKRGHDPRTLRFYKTLPLSKRMWVELFENLFPESEKFGKYVAHEWKRGWIAVYNIISQFECLTPLRQVPLVSFHAVATTLLSIVTYVDHVNKENGKPAPTNDDIKSALGI